MSLFIAIEEETQRVRVCSDELSWSGQYGKRYARLVLNYKAREVQIWAYSWPVRKMIPADANERDLLLSVTGTGRNKDFQVRPLDPCHLTTMEERLIQNHKINLPAIVEGLQRKAEEASNERK